MSPKQMEAMCDVRNNTPSVIHEFFNSDPWKKYHTSLDDAIVAALEAGYCYRCPAHVTLFAVRASDTTPTTMFEPCNPNAYPTDTASWRDIHCIFGLHFCSKTWQQRNHYAVSAVIFRTNGAFPGNFREGIWSGGFEPMFQGARDEGIIDGARLVMVLESTGACTEGLPDKSVGIAQRDDVGRPLSIRKNKAKTKELKDNDEMFRVGAMRRLYIDVADVDGFLSCEEKDEWAADFDFAGGW
jgi:hypothetical protein